MLKLVFLVKAQAGVSHEALRAYWLERHMPGVRDHMRPDRYAITFFEQRTKPHATPYDGMAELWYEDYERGFHVHGTGIPKAVAEDGFTDLTDAHFLRLECEEHVIVDGTADGPLKLTFLVEPRPGVDRAALYRHWLGVHAPLVAAGLRKTDGAERYVVSTVTLARRERPLAGIAELYYRDPAAAKAHAAKLGDDGFGEHARTVAFMQGEEVRIL